MGVRSTFAGINTMYRGVSTNRLSLETTGHNMTNANVEGYSRQSVNQAAVMPDTIYANGIRQFVGSGVDSLSITRARDVYADKQYWREFSDQEYAKTRQTNYQKLEAIFNDSDDTGLQNAILNFYQSWVDMSKEASNTSERVAVIEQAGILIDRVKASGKIGYGFDAYNEKYVDMLEVGIVDPTKVTRSALQNAASIASTVLTTESVVANKKEETPAAAPAAGGMGGMY